MSQTMKSFEVHLSRVTTSIVLGIPLVFLFFGIDFLFLNLIIDETWIINGVPFFVNILAVIFFIIVPLIIIYKQISHLRKPPVMLHIDKDFVSFGHGMNYKPYKIPTKYLLSVGAGFAAPSTSTLRPEQFVAGGGIRLKFEKHEDVPFGKIASAGLVFQNHNLTISRFYADQSISKIIEGVTPFISNRKTP